MDDKDTPVQTDEVIQEEPHAGDAHADLIAEAEAELSAPGAHAQETPKTQEPQAAAAAQAAQAQNEEERKKYDKLTASWPEEDKKLFASAPENLRALVGKYYHNMLTDYKQKTQQAAALKSAVEKDLNALKPVVSGKFKDINEFAAYVSDMQHFEAALQADPRRTLALLARRTGVDLRELSDYRPDPVQEAVQPLRAQMEQLERMLAQKARGTDAQPAPQEGEEDPAKEALAQFARQTDGAGNLKHPYFEQVAPVMGLLLKGESPEDLEEAYKQAVYVLPKAREELLAKEQQAYAAKQRELEKAKRAASVAVHERGVSGVTNKKKSIDDIIAQAQEELGGGA